MRETSIMDNLNCKMQVHARVSEENNLEKPTPIKIIYNNLENDAY